MTFPNFFIVGAPKCGTTALHAYLAQHPDVFMSDPKEPHFFGSDLEFRYRRSDAQYPVLLRGWGRRRRIGGEASVWYPYSECAADEIGEALPDARIIVMLRDPVEMIPSLHSQFVYNGHEDLGLGHALAAEQERAAGRRPPPGPTSRAACSTGAWRYAPQLARYLDRFGRERVHVIVYDDLRADLPGEYRRLLEFPGRRPRIRARLHSREREQARAAPMAPAAHLEPAAAPAADPRDAKVPGGARPARAAAEPEQRARCATADGSGAAQPPPRRIAARDRAARTAHRARPVGMDAAERPSPR